MPAKVVAKTPLRKPRTSRSSTRSSPSKARATVADAVARAAAQAAANLAAPRWRADLRRRLLAWFDRAARELPWRASRDPYRVWVSEIMLQQTVVAAVVPYFERFIARFPTVTALADGDEDEVLRLWEGLGYYRRARQLHRAARVVRDEHGGTFPRDVAAVRALPGIGRYTAGAIMSIAFDEPQPILEANTIRLFARLLAYGGDTASARGQALLWSTAEALLPRREAGRFNQALMELGALVCTPRQPRCGECPLRALCPTRAWELTEAVPAARPRPQIEQVREAAVVMRRGAQVLIVRRQATERWAGLWDFPRLPLEAAAQSPAATVAEHVRKQTGWHITLGEKLTTIRHSVTRFRIALECYEAAAVRQEAARGQQREMRWVTVPELAEHALCTSGRKLARFLARE